MSEQESQDAGEVENVSNNRVVEETNSGHDVLSALAESDPAVTTSVVVEGADTASQATAEDPAQPAPVDPAELARQLDAQAQGGEETEEDEEEVRLEDQPAEEVFSGAFVPNANVEETLPVLEEISDAEIAELAKNGSVYLTNQSLDELGRIYETVNRKVLMSQPRRHELALLNLADDYYAIELPGDDEGVLYLTDTERKAMAIIQSYRRGARQGLGRNIFEDGSKWTNLPSVGDVKIAIGKNDHSNSKDPILRMRGALGMSTEYPTPLWGTGMNLVLNSPGALDQLRLETRLLLEKTDFGRESVGYSYSAAAVYLNREVANFILGHVARTNCGVTDPEALKKIILLTDLEPLAAAAGSSIYPDGYLLERPCLATNGGCGFVTTRKINVRRMMFVSTSRLTEHQMSLMSKRTSHVDPATIKNYQSQMRPDVSRLVELDGNYRLRLAVPTLFEYERVASAWMDRMQNSAKELVSSNANRAEREAYLARASQLALIMAYGHWVESVVEVGGDLGTDETILYTRNVGDNIEEQYGADLQMDKFLEDLSADSGRTTKVIAAIEKFINQMTVSTVAVPKVTCPGCGKPVTGDKTSNHPHLVSVNAIELFFTLLRHKTRNAGK